MLQTNPLPANGMCPVTYMDAGHSFTCSWLIVTSNHAHVVSISISLRKGHALPVTKRLGNLWGKLQYRLALLFFIMYLA